MEKSSGGIRRRHGKELKRQVLAECTEPGASVARVAKAHGLKSNLVQRWRRLAAPERLWRTNLQRDLRSRHCSPRCQTGIGRHPHRTSLRPGGNLRHLADGRRQRGRGLDARDPVVIRIDTVWLAVEPLDMRAGTDSALARVVNVIGAARPRHAYLFLNRRANRMKVLVHDGNGVWLAARRQNGGRIVWPRDIGSTLTLTWAQLDVLLLGLPWLRIGEAGIITFRDRRRTHRQPVSAATAPSLARGGAVNN